MFACVTCLPCREFKSLLSSYACNQSVIEHLKNIFKRNEKLFLYLRKCQICLFIYLAFKLSDDIMSTSDDSPCCKLFKIIVIRSKNLSADKIKHQVVSGTH